MASNRKISDKFAMQSDPFIETVLIDKFFFQSEISRKREAELTKVKKDMELLVVQYESTEASLRKKHQDALNDLSEQLDHMSRLKSK